MPDILNDGDFTRPTPVGARRYEYPFRTNGDRVSAIFEEDYWQTTATYTPTEFPIPHAELPDFFLINESEPRPFFGNLFVFTRTYARVPSQQTEYSSIFFSIPDVRSADGTRTTRLGVALGLANGFDPSSSPYSGYGLGLLAANFFFSQYVGVVGQNIFWAPLKAANAVSYTGNRSQLVIPAHGYTNAANQYMVFARGNAANSTEQLLTLFSLVSSNVNTPGSWHVINSDAINGPFTENYMGGAIHVAGTNVGEFGTNSRFVRCKRVTDFYLPGVTPGIVTPNDIPLPSPDLQNAGVFDALLSGSGTFNERVGELGRWRGSAIYAITRTVIEVTDAIA